MNNELKRKFDEVNTLVALAVPHVGASPFDQADRRPTILDASVGHHQTMAIKREVRYTSDNQTKPFATTTSAGYGGQLTTWHVHIYSIQFTITITRMIYHISTYTCDDVRTNDMGGPCVLDTNE